MTSQCCCCSDSCSSARSDKCHKQNSNPFDLFKRFSMDLEFNILGFGFTKRCSGINLPPFGTTLVYWESFYIKFLFMPQCCGYRQLYWFRIRLHILTVELHDYLALRTSLFRGKQKRHTCWYILLKHISLQCWIGAKKLKIRSNERI